MNQAPTGTSRVSPVATSEISPCSLISAKSSALAKICFRRARIVVPFATKRRPTAGLRQFIEKCDAVTLPINVAAANPQAVSSNAAIIPACRCPAYWVKSSRHRMRISAAPSPAATTSNSASRLNAAEALTATRFWRSKPAWKVAGDSISFLLPVQNKTHLVSGERKHRDRAQHHPAKMLAARAPGIAERAEGKQQGKGHDHPVPRRFRLHRGRRNQQHAAGDPGDGRNLPDQAKQRAQPLRLDGDAWKDLGFGEDAMDRGGDNGENTRALQQDIAHVCLHTVVHGATPAAGGCQYSPV